MINEQKSQDNPPKQEIWLEKLKKVAERKDRLGQEMDPKIIETVTILNLLGIPTSGSCEGHEDSGLVNPWVDFVAMNEPKEHNSEEYKKWIIENKMLMEIVSGFIGEFYKDNPKDEEKMVFTREIGGIAGRIQAGKEEAGGNAKDVEELSKRLTNRQGEMKRFTEFLKSKFF